MTNHTSLTIQLDTSTPLPCSTYNAERNAPCGQPATVCYAYEHRRSIPPILVEWIVHPVCRECEIKEAERCAG